MEGSLRFFFMSGSEDWHCNLEKLIDTEQDQDDNFGLWSREHLWQEKEDRELRGEWATRLWQEGTRPTKIT